MVILHTRQKNLITLTGSQVAGTEGIVVRRKSGRRRRPMRRERRGGRRLLLLRLRLLLLERRLRLRRGRRGCCGGLVHRAGPRRARPRARVQLGQVGRTSEGVDGGRRGGAPVRRPRAHAHLATAALTPGGSPAVAATGAGSAHVHGADGGSAAELGRKSIGCCCRRGRRIRCGRGCGRWLHRGASEKAHASGASGRGQRSCI